MFYQIFLSPQVKRSAISSTKHGIYELTYKVQTTKYLLGSQDIRKGQENLKTS